MWPIRFNSILVSRGPPRSSVRLGLDSFLKIDSILVLTAAPRVLRCAGLSFPFHSIRFHSIRFDSILFDSGLTCSSSKFRACRAISSSFLSLSSASCASRRLQGSGGWGGSAMGRTYHSEITPAWSHQDRKANRKDLARRPTQATTGCSTLALGATPAACRRVSPSANRGVNVRV